MAHQTDYVKPEIKGHLQIFDKTDANNNVMIAEAFNSVNYENMSYAIAQSLSRKNASGAYLGPIKQMVFGNGGTSVNGVGVVTYLDKNVIGQSATLYNQTYSKIIDQNNTQNINPIRNYMDVAHVSGNLFSDLLVVCTLEFGEPAGQMALDNATTMNDNFIFDELGLVNYDGKLLTHVIFHPCQKANNRIFEIRYSLRIALV